MRQETGTSAVWKHKRGTQGIDRVASLRGLPDGGDGEYRLLLEAAVQHLRTLRAQGHGRQRPRYEECPRTQDRRQGRGMDCRPFAAWSSESELYPEPRAAGTPGGIALQEESHRGARPRALPGVLAPQRPYPFRQVHFRLQLAVEGRDQGREGCRVLQDPLPDP